MSDLADAQMAILMERHRLEHPEPVVIPAGSAVDPATGKTYWKEDFRTALREKRAIVRNCEQEIEPRQRARDEALADIERMLTRARSLFPNFIER